MIKKIATAMDVTASLAGLDTATQFLPAGYIVPECAHNCVWYERGPEQADQCSNRTSFVCRKYRNEVFRWLAE